MTLTHADVCGLFNDKDDAAKWLSVANADEDNAVNLYVVKRSMGQVPK